MDSGHARHLFKAFAGAVAYVAVEHPDGTSGIGTAFHVGEGVFVTARHVVDGVKVSEIGITESTYVPLQGEAAERASVYVVTGEHRTPVHIVRGGVLKLEAGPFFHPNADVDVAAFRVKGIDTYAPWVRLGGHLDDWMGQSDFTLTECILFGYPPVPLTTRPYLVAARAEVSAQLDLRDRQHVHFILSCMPRGGFSGGLVITEDELALGVVTSSLLGNNAAAELGFCAVMSVEPIYVCLSSHKLLPGCQSEGFEDFWNLESEYLFDRGEQQGLFARQIVGSIGLFDDGCRMYLELSCDTNQAVLEEAINVACACLAPFSPRRVEIRPGMIQLHVNIATEEARGAFERAQHAARGAMAEAGFVADGNS
jgi:hypothetical protein